MTPGQIIYLLRAIAAVVLVAALWWSWDKVVAAIRAPAYAERDAAVDANHSLQADITRLANEKKALADTLAARSSREGEIDKKLEALDKKLALLKSKNPAVQKWADTPIPPEVLQ